MYLFPDPCSPAYTSTTSPATLEITTLLEQGSGPHNEDRLLCDHDQGLFGVFDGATSLGGSLPPTGETGGQAAARICAEHLQRGTGSLVSRAILANSALRDFQRSQNPDWTTRHLRWSTSLAAILIENNRMEYLQTGDAQILLLKADETFELLGPDQDIDAESLRLLQKARRNLPRDLKTLPSPYQLIPEQLIKVRQAMNRSYGVLNGEDEAIDFLVSGSTSLSDVTHILLLTDGLFLPRSTPGNGQDWAALAALYSQGGLQALHRHVKGLQSLDPHLLLYPRFKQSDDIAAISLRLSG